MSCPKPKFDRKVPIWEQTVKIWRLIFNAKPEEAARLIMILRNNVDLAYRSREGAKKSGSRKINEMAAREFFKALNLAVPGLLKLKICARALKEGT
jgi:hypothetical protein